VQIEIHRGEPNDLRHNIDARKLVSEFLIDSAIGDLRVAVLHVLPRREQEASRAGPLRGPFHNFLK
jgi:hypothetical protein